jgi:hypothetical protein
MELEAALAIRRFVGLPEGSQMMNSIGRTVMWPVAVVILSGTLLLFGGCAVPKNADEPRTTAVTIAGREYKEEELKKLLGGAIRDAVVRLRVRHAWAAHFITEPTGFLCGKEYFMEDDASISIFVDPGDPMCHTFSDTLEWDENQFGRARVGGIQCEKKDAHVAVGSIPGPSRHWYQRSREKNKT